MQPPLSYSCGSDTSPAGDVCVYEHMFSNKSRHTDDGSISTVKQIVRDLKNLEHSQELEFVLVLVTNDSSEQAEVFTSAALDGHTTSILPTSRSDHLLKLVAEHRSTFQSPTGTRRSSTVKVDPALPASDGALISPDDCGLFGRFSQAISDAISAAGNTAGYKLVPGAWRPSLVRAADDDAVKDDVTAPRATAPETRNAGSLMSVACDPSMTFSSPTAATIVKSEEAVQVYLSPQSTVSNPSSPTAQTLSEHMPLMTTPSTQKEEVFLSQAQRSRPPALFIRAGEQIPSPQRADDGYTEYYPLVISDREAVTAFLGAKFRQLQQVACKVVAKAWIKVIEPKKQSNHPYNKGDEFKPDWWPSEARHKEPDHLMKPERLVLLVSMLRCGRVELKQLRGATTECAISISPEKMEVLEEIYYVADMEEQYRRLGNSLGVVDQAAKYNTRRNEDKKQFIIDDDDGEVVVWTIRPEKLPASSRSLNIITSRTHTKRSRSEMDFDLSDIQGILESKRSSYIPPVPTKSSALPPQKSQVGKGRKDQDCGHHDNHMLALQDTRGTQDLQFGSVIPLIAESSTSFGMFTPRELQNGKSECRCRDLPKRGPSVDDGPIPLPSHRRYTTGSLQGWMSDHNAYTSSADSDSLFTCPPRRHSQQVTIPTRPHVASSAGSSGVRMETSFDNADDYSSFAHMLSDVGSSSLESPKPVSSAQRIASNGEYAGTSDMSFEADLAAYAAVFGRMATSTSGLSELGGLG
ncbi:hypothetical protein V1525DRAFT_447766 [Lipomyces kononenkoae]|uniref:Uncharacterized protein n=1 Tax=Lipomyces kononenkoae TaxID=34357 RepID=A0ACC3TBS0_LIPKO